MMMLVACTTAPTPSVVLVAVVACMGRVSLVPKLYARTQTMRNFEAESLEDLGT